jgi:hypothetical protein
VVDGYEGKPAIYVLDLGEDSFKSFRYIKIQFVGVKGGAYQFKWGYVNVPSLAYLTQMVTDQTKNYVYYSFSKKDVVEMNPLLVKIGIWYLPLTKNQLTIPMGFPIHISFAAHLQIQKQSPLHKSTMALLMKHATKPLQFNKSSARMPMRLVTIGKNIVNLLENTPLFQTDITS